MLFPPSSPSSAFPPNPVTDVTDICFYLVQRAIPRISAGNLGLVWGRKGGGVCPDRIHPWFRPAFSGYLLLGGVHRLEDDAYSGFFLYFRFYLFVVFFFLSLLFFLCSVMWRGLAATV